MQVHGYTVNWDDESFMRTFSFVYTKAKEIGRTDAVISEEIIEATEKLQKEIEVTGSTDIKQIGGINKLKGLFKTPPPAKELMAWFHKTVAGLKANKTEATAPTATKTVVVIEPVMTVEENKVIFVRKESLPELLDKHKDITSLDDVIKACVAVKLNAHDLNNWVAAKNLAFDLFAKNNIEAAKAWNKIVTIKDFTIDGGETFTHNNLDQWAIGLREVFSDIKDFKIVTNGTLLPKYVNRFDAWFDLDIIIEISFKRIGDYQILNQYLSKYNNVQIKQHFMYDQAAMLQKKRIKA
jgi:hypothetical protein